MCCTPQDFLNTHKRTDKKAKIRLLALVVCVCFVSLSILSSFFISTHADHPHDHDGPGGGCAACVVLQSVQNLQKQLGMALACAGITACCLFAANSSRTNIAFRAGFATPVLLKVRLNN